MAVEKNCQVMTPSNVVRLMLDHIGYYGQNVRRKHIIDNSCGDGNFLIEIIRRYFYAIESSGDYYRSDDQYSLEIFEYVHGIEKDRVLWRKCCDRVNSLLRELFGDDLPEHFKAENIIKCEDTLQVSLIGKYENLMDFVIGNPPYINVHNLRENYDLCRSYSFCSEGMTDIYLAFFELGFKMLKPGGKLIYVTPISWLTSAAGKKLRNFILDGKNSIRLNDVIDFEYNAVFKGISTYPIISCFRKLGTDNRFNTEKFSIYKVENSELKLKLVESFKSVLDCNIEGKFYLCDADGIAKLKQINSNNVATKIIVKNGLATLNDSAFIGDSVPDSKYRIPMIKASKGIKTFGLFPYDAEGKQISLDKLKADKSFIEYINKNSYKQTISGDDIFYYGKTQAIKDVYKDKVAINNLLRSVKDIKIVEAPSGTGVYCSGGGYYILGADVKTIEHSLKTEDFIDYVKSLKKYKNGGYFYFSTKDLEKYLNYKIKYKNDGSV